MNQHNHNPYHNQLHDENNSNSNNSNSNNDEEELALKRSLQFHIGKLCQNHITTDNNNNVTRITPEAVTALTELAWHYTTSSLANDLAMFSRHRSSHRRTLNVNVNVEDVKLCARKLPDKLKGDLEVFCTAAAAVHSNSSSSKCKYNIKNPIKSSRKAGKDDIIVDDMDDVDHLDAVQRRDYYLKKAADLSSSDDDNDNDNDNESNANSSDGILDIRDSSVNKKMQVQQPILQLEILSSSSSSSSSSNNEGDDGEEEFVFEG